jgi:hypothetical protein
MTKQTLMAEAGVLRSIDGFDEELPFREWSDLMLRLNPVCSIEGVPVPGYLLSRDGALHMSRESGRVQRGFDALRAKHLDLLEAHPRGHADLLLGQARVALVSGPRRAAPGSIARALRLAPGHTLRTLLDPRRAVAALARPGRTG